MQLSIIIVNYNVKFFLEQCLFSVVKACSGIEAEIFVVDNHSTDGSRAWLEPKFPAVKFRWNSLNEGFGKASNSVLKETTGDFILFLNPDTIVPEDCFEKCIAFFQHKQNCGALGIRMVDGSGKFLKESKRSFPSAKFSFFKIAGLAKLFPSSKLFAGYYAGHLPENKNNPVDVLAGAFMILSKKAIEATRGFDEAFFMYGEDIDLSYRLQKAGFENWYFADTTIVHFKGESTQKRSASYVRDFYGAMRLFVNKHYGQQKAERKMLLASIKLLQLSAGMKNRIRKTSHKNANPVPPKNTVIVAGQERFNQTLQLIKYASPIVAVCGRISANNLEKKAAIGTLDSLNETVKKNKVEQIVFCEGEQSFKSFIDLLPSIPLRVITLINAANSSSIVGSNDKNQQGVFIAKP